MQRVKKVIQGPSKDIGNDSFDVELEDDTNTLNVPHLVRCLDDEPDDVDFYMGDDPQELNFD